MRNTRGFSLFGMIATIILLAILAYLIAPHFMANARQQNIAKMKQDFSAINDALEAYKLDNGTYPSTEQGLDALIHQPTLPPVPQYWNQKGYLPSLPVDPWGQPYQYTNNEEVDRVFSFGPGGGGEGASGIDLTNVDSQ